MKVLFLVNNFPDNKNPYGGVFVYNQVKALVAAGIDVQVLYLDFRSIRRLRRWGMSTYQYNGISIYHYSIPCGPFKKLYYWLINHSTIRAFRKVCDKEGEFDLIHAHFTDMGLAARAIQSVKDVKYILTEHSSTLLQKEHSEEEQKHLYAAYERADKILAVGTELKKRMQVYTKQSIEVVPNILPSRFCIYEDVAKDVDSFVFISVVGTLTKEKKVDVLLEAFYKLHKEAPNTLLRICGEGNLMEELKKKVSDYGINDSVEFLGVVDNFSLPQLLNQCDCFVLPSVMETFGVVYIEAGGCGLPLISANSGGTKDIIDNDNGIIIENAGVEDVYEAMRDVMLNKSKYISQKISEDIRKKFGEQAFQNKIIKIYTEVCGTRDDV